VSGKPNHDYTPADGESRPNCFDKVKDEIEALGIVARFFQMWDLELTGVDRISQTKAPQTQF
jgi:hypothetical protein